VFSPFLMRVSQSFYLPTDPSEGNGSVATDLFQSSVDDVYLGQMPVKQPTMSVSFCYIFRAVFN